jgi:hypothetical protein
VYRRLGGIRGVLSKGLYFFSMEREAKIFGWEQDFLYTTEKYQQLREKCLLVIRCHI